MAVFYTVKDLTIELRNAKLPSSRMYLNMLEREGVIPMPQNSVHFRVKDASKIAKSEMRIYTKEEMDLIVTLVRLHKAKTQELKKES